MTITNRKTSPAMKIAAVILVVAAGVLTVSKTQLFSDSRFEALHEGDYVRVRRVSGGFRLDVYMAQLHEVGNLDPEFATFLAQLPRIQKVQRKQLVLAAPGVDEGQIYQSASIRSIQIIRDGASSWSKEESANTTLEEAEFEFFGDLTLSVYQPLINRVVAADTPVTWITLNSAKGTTQKDYWLGYRRFRNLDIEDYQTTTKDPANAQAICLAFLSAYLDSASQSEDALSGSAILQLARDALSLSDHPVLRLYAARHQQLVSDPEGARKSFSNVLTDVEDSLPPTSRFVAHVMQLTDYRVINTNISRKDHLAAITDFVQSSSAIQPWIGLHPQELPYVSTLYRSGWEHLDDHGKEKLLKSLLKDPTSDRWLCHSLASVWHNERGWNHRGQGLLSEVPAAKQELFASELYVAACHALAALTIRPDLPESAVLLNNIARTGELDIGTARAWFLQGIRTQFDCMPLYEDYLLALYPRWGGSHSQMIDFAEACAGCSRFDTDVPYFSIDCLEAIQTDTGSSEVTWKRTDVVSVLESFRRALPAKSDDAAVDRRVVDALSRCAAVAFLGDNLPEARAAFQAMGEVADTPWFDHYGLDAGPIVRQQVFARSGPAAQLILELDEAISAQGATDPSSLDITALRATLEKIRAADDNSFLLDYCDQRDIVLSAYEKFAAGEVVDLPFNESQNLWENLSDDALLQDGTFSIPPDRRRTSPAYAELRPQFPPPFQVSFALAYGTNSTEKNSAGVLVCDPSLQQKNRLNDGVFIYGNRGNSGIWWTSGGSPQLLGQPKFEAVNRLKVSVFTDHCDVEFNDVPLGTVPRNPTSSKALIRIGSPIFSQTVTDATFQNPSIQKLNP